MNAPENNLLRFPSGLSVRRIKQKAKILTKKTTMNHCEALDVLAAENGINLPWPDALQLLKQEAGNTDSPVE